MHHKIGYELPPAIRQGRDMGVGFGFGERSKQGRNGKDSPSPDKYDISSVFDKSKMESPSKGGSQSQMNSILSSTNSPRRTFSFGAGRGDFEKSCYNSKLYQDKIVPGPGTYTDNSRSVGVNGRKNSCHNKLYTLDPATEAKKNDLPGPGTYKPISMHTEGKYHISTFSSSKAANFTTGRRFKSIEPTKFVPGPGAYEQTGSTAKSNHGCTNFHSILTRTMKTTEKQRPEFGGRFKTPGPGTYRPPSDFGYVDNLHSPISPREFNAQNSMASSQFERGARRTHNASFAANSPKQRNAANFTLTAFSDRKEVFLQDPPPNGRNSQMTGAGRTGSQLYQISATPKGYENSKSGSKIANMRALNSMRHMNTDAPNSRVQAIRMNPDVKMILKTQKREYSEQDSNPVSPATKFNQTTQAFTSAQDPVSPTPGSQWESDRMTTQGKTADYANRMQTVKSVYTNNNTQQRKRRSSMHSSGQSSQGSVHSKGSGRGKKNNNGPNQTAQPIDKKSPPVEAALDAKSLE